MTVECHPKSLLDLANSRALAPALLDHPNCSFMVEAAIVGEGSDRRRRHSHACVSIVALGLLDHPSCSSMELSIVNSLTNTVKLRRHEND